MNTPGSIPYTPVNYTFPFPKIRAQGTLAAIGSCFAQDIAMTLLDSGMRGMINPNGILYNPYSINDALQRLECGYTESDFFELNGLWHSWRHHGSFSAASAAEGAANANESAKRFRRTLKKADFFLMTVSTAVVYKHMPERLVVANCHKAPGNEFEQSVLSYDICRAAMRNACEIIRSYNAKCPIIITLSPVRHNPGDLTTNSLSKARLRAAAADVCARVDGCAYFPAFEILNDELRDYRFYAEDMLHPSELARKIILERFLDACFIPRAKADYEAAELRRRQSRHIPLAEKEK